MLRLLGVFAVPGGGRLLLLALPPLTGLGLLAAAFTLGPSAAAPAAPAAAAPAAADELPAPSGLLVHVSGAVTQPGLYRLKRGDRVYAAIAAAGGLSPEADPARLPDLAGRLRDGEQVRVPFRRSAAAGSSRAPKADLNTASAEELAALPGFTPELAQAVVDYRTTYGPFLKTSELVNALGMSQADYKLAQRYLSV